MCYTRFARKIFFFFFLFKITRGCTQSLQSHTIVRVYLSRRAPRLPTLLTANCIYRFIFNKYFVFVRSYFLHCDHVCPSFSCCFAGSDVLTSGHPYIRFLSMSCAILCKVSLKSILFCTVKKQVFINFHDVFASRPLPCSRRL